MTTEQKLSYIADFMRLVTSARTYRDACAHSNFVRGITNAWRVDGSITVDQWQVINKDIEIVMEVKRNLPTEGDVV